MKDNFIDNYIFEKEKDLPVKNATCFYFKIKDVYKVYPSNRTELYKRIINYQVKKYGSSLQYGYRKTKEEKERLSRNARYRKRYRLNKGRKQ